MSDKLYNYSTIITNYLYRQSENEEGLYPLTMIPHAPNGLLNEEEIQMHTYLLDHESQYGTPTLETVRLADHGAYENMIETKIVEGKEVPMRGHGASYKFLLESFNEFARNRRLDVILNTMSAGDEGDSTVEDTLAELYSIPMITFAETEDFFSTYEDEMERLEEEQNNGISLGINRHMDTQLGLIHRGKMGLIAGETGSNKTWILVQLAFRAAFLEDKKVLFCTYEMTTDDVGKRVKGIMGQFNTMLYSVDTPKNRQILDANTELVYKIRDFYLKNGKLTPMVGANVAQMKTELDRELEETGIPYDLVLVDGGYLIPAPSHMAAAAPWMKTVANLDQLSKIKLGSWEGDKVKIKYPIVLTAQMGKGKSGDSLADMGDSVRLGQDADFVVNVKIVGENIRSSKILKNRNGIVPTQSYLYAIDYNSSTILGYVSGDVDTEERVTVNTEGWEAIYAIMQKKNFATYFPDIDSDIVKLASIEPDLKSPMVYRSVQKEFVYPTGGKEVFDKFTKEDQALWKKFLRQVPNIFLIRSYEKVILARYE